MEQSQKTKNKIINLIKKIFAHYIELEKNSSNNILYYTHTEFDSNVTEFEGLCNSNKIVLATKLDKHHIPAIMQIFKSIYSNNFWIFETTVWVDIIYHDKYNTDDVDSLMSYDNVNLWMQVFDKFNTDENENENDELDESNNNIYDHIPSVCSEYYKSKKKQKIYTLDDISKLLDNHN